MANNPVAIRFTDADLKLLKNLGKLTGLTTPGVLRLALRVLDDRERRMASLSGERSELESGAKKRVKA